MKKLTILDGHAVNPGDLPWNFLDGIVDYKVYERTSPEEVIERIGNSDAVFLIKSRLQKKYSMPALTSNTSVFLQQVIM